MNDAGAVDLVLPASIPFADLKGRDLEECVFWLFDSMGARDLEWRTGGKGGGAADGGRDLEAYFYVPAPDGDMEPQRWWIECKGRKGTVEASEVKEAVNNSASQQNLTYLVIATNTTYSNPTRDWVKDWQKNHQLPRVKLWDHETLERLLSKHPNVVLRLFSEALSPEGLLMAVEKRFWERLEYSPERALQTFWQDRSTIKIEPLQRVALIANEFARGNIERRPWAAIAKPVERIQALHIALANLGYLYLRLIRVGEKEEPILETFVHLILAALQVISSDDVALMIIEHGLSSNGEKMPTKVAEQLFLPVLDRLMGEVRDVCTSDCERFYDHPVTTLVSEAMSVESYPRRFSRAGVVDTEGDGRYAVLQNTTKPCRAGFALDGEKGCPLYEIDHTLERLPDLLSVVEQIVDVRFPRPLCEPSSVDDEA